MGSNQPGYAYIWEYLVRPERVREFEDAYGPNGLWVQLFKRGHGYVRTELHRDRRQANRYVTIDYWESVEAWEAFRAGESAAFEALDLACGELTLEELEIGAFHPLGSGRKLREGEPA